MGRAQDAVQRASRRIRLREATVRAWTYLDLPGAEATAATIDSRASGDLGGMTVGVKDNVDTFDMPTTYGCRGHDGHRPIRDASAVALLRAADAVILGKTVTAELAYLGTGVTRNPHNRRHTAGGSSMGSAAAVAAGMADVALGTQTGGSVLRPAAYCGVVGFKPTFGLVAVDGVKPLAPSLDTIGWLTRDVVDLWKVLRVLAGTAASRPVSGQPRLRVHAGELDHLAAACVLAAVEDCAQVGERNGAVITRAARVAPVERGLSSAQETVMAFEAYRSLVIERSWGEDRLGDAVRAGLQQASRISAAAYHDALALRERALEAIDDLFEAGEVLLSPTVPSEAPRWSQGTGDPAFLRVWTLLGCPALNLPWGRGPRGLPVGVQLVGRPGADREVLATAEWLDQCRRAG